MGNWLKKWWWTLLLGLGLVAAFLYFLFRKKKAGEPTETTFTQRAREKILEAETDARIDREKVLADTDQARAELAKIEAMEDPVERRKKLAEYLDEEL